MNRQEAFNDLRMLRKLLDEAGTAKNKALSAALEIVNNLGKNGYLIPSKPAIAQALEDKSLQNGMDNVIAGLDKVAGRIALESTWEEAN